VLPVASPVPLSTEGSDAMLSLVITLTKGALLVFWLACILSLLSLIPNPYGQTILWIGASLLLVHLIEYLFVKSKVAERTDGDSGFIPTMVFGFGHWLPILKRLD
jgi:uncharacterized protein YhhL (DUF1145 family)